MLDASNSSPSHENFLTIRVKRVPTVVSHYCKLCTTIPFDKSLQLLDHTSQQRFPEQTEQSEQIIQQNSASTHYKHKNNGVCLATT